MNNNFKGKSNKVNKAAVATAATTAGTTITTTNKAVSQFDYHVAQTTMSAYHDRQINKLRLQ
ncbi:hypothetical protein TYRP_013533 [Tyrophagus putrescentiae]|nr:hypothetical protein TYRP_013533 [Tyrophagus putrescentiae]